MRDRVHIVRRNRAAPKPANSILQQLAAGGDALLRGLSLLPSSRGTALSIYQSSSRQPGELLFGDHPERRSIDCEARSS
jgi:hypothetical protein